MPTFERVYITQAEADAMARAAVTYYNPGDAVTTMLRRLFVEGDGVVIEYFVRAPVDRE